VDPRARTFLVGRAVLAARSSARRLNAWAPQIEGAIQASLGSSMVAEGRVQQLAENGAV
jgi:hypothetical protein